jgi:hypothetical protein
LFKKSRHKCKYASSYYIYIHFLIFQIISKCEKCAGTFPRWLPHPCSLGWLLTIAPASQAIKDIPIYAKIIRDLCIKKPGRKKKEPPLVQVVGQLSKFNSKMPYKYNDLRNPTVTIEINVISLPNTLIYLGEAINVIPFDTMQKIQINQLRPTQTMIELVDKLVISPAGSLDDIIVTLTSWEYLVDFLIIYSKSSSKPGNLVVLGLPWLAIADAIINCHSSEMTISNGTHSQKLVLFPPTQPT